MGIFRQTWRLMFEMGRRQRWKFQSNWNNFDSILQRGFPPRVEKFFIYSKRFFFNMCKGVPKFPFEKRRGHSICRRKRRTSSVKCHFWLTEKQLNRSTYWLIFQECSSLTCPPLPFFFSLIPLPVHSTKRAESFEKYFFLLSFSLQLGGVAETLFP